MSETNHIGIGIGGPGGFTAARKVTVRDYEVFRRAFLNGPIDAKYTPLTCMSQIVSGKNYLFGAQEDYFVENGTRHELVVVSIFEALPCNGGGVYIKSIKSCCSSENENLTKQLFAGMDVEINETASASSHMTGAFTEPGELSEHTKEVFARAVAQGPIGVKFEAYEVATQVVSGTNYRFSCYAKTIAPEAREYKVHMYVFEALPCYGGAVEITSIEEIS